ncbi:hypothetical protein ITJ50_09315 [Curtobacterium sp. VKM Ac-2889]|uniref:hypothetical protein n=1 Tax=Curtobacterium TaxID=2034 RepID=UPI00188B7AA2|nr:MULTISPECIES: hypothetical protein [Curtobacterium]MBF4596299.1 hypothetical protein [Curtobacterium sp. VKM Ac-1796]MBF4611416.1 hypothetical protein [Curtobacterium sp. VKM Ac-2889]MBT1620464.1 hypothetical protein [Curtobacterium flaccumfaciens pv. poinsettiae]
MTLELDHVGIGEEPGAPLPVVSAVAAPGRPGVLAVETEQAPVLASLVAGGRMQPDTGRLLLDGHEDPAAVRRAFALVDTPGIAEPFPVLTLKQIVREELAFAGQRPNREHVDTVLDELGLRDYVDTAVQRVPTAVRIRLLVELALLRDGVTGIVITSPERHGGAVEDWFQVVRDVARRGVTVVLVTSKAAAATVEHLLETIETHDEVETHDDVATPGVATPGVAETLEQPQTEDPEDVARTDGTEPGLLAAPSVTTASATVPTEAQK